MPSRRISIFSSGRKFAVDRSLLLKFLALLAIFIFIISWLLIELSLGEQRKRLLDNMEERARVLVWSIEGGARFVKNRDIQNLAAILREIGRQPGIAWLALVNSQGRIMVDSHEELDNTELYSPAEMEALAAGNELQGRFSPDDPQIYETWKLFRPGRIAGRTAFSENYVIFIAIDANGFYENLKILALRLWLLSFAVAIALLCLVALSFYIYNFGQSRKKLAETEAFALQIISDYPSALLVCDNEGQILLSNARAQKMFGIPDDNHSLRLNDLAYFDWKHIFRSLQRHSPLPDEEIDLHLKNGQHKLVSLASALIPGHSQPDYLLSFKDQDEIMQLKRKLLHSEKLSEAGRLASGLAHEIRNPLSSIRGYAHYLQMRLANDPMAQTTASLLMEETERINNAVSGLLNLVRKPQLNLARNSLKTLLEKATALARPDAEAANIQLQLYLPPGLPDDCWPLSDREKLLQVFLNLLLNSIQAMPDGGIIKISLESIQSNMQQLATWKITFRDNGKGMTEEVRKQIFTPYFTTRAEGTGLGLAIVRQILESHNGRIEAASSPGNGAIFSIFLPVEQCGKK